MPQFNDDVIPDTTGRRLGLPDRRYDANIRNLDVSGTISGDFSIITASKLTPTVVPYNPTPLFACAPNQGNSFEITLTGDVTLPVLTGLEKGMLIAFLIKQDLTGNRAFTWPLNVSGGADIGTESNERTLQLFYSDGTTLFAITPGVIQ